MERTASRPADNSLGHSEPFLAFQQRLSQAARVERPVLLIGERGTGKELAATRLHYLSPRWQEPLVTLNCAALTPNLITSELFGHEAGAFTGAAGRRAGRFEAADGGSLFLDEIGQSPMDAQEKILRAVEYGTFERVGASQPVRVDVRLIAAAQPDLPALAERGRFKRDLLDRLSFEVLLLPPLRERHGDIPLLAAHFAARMSAELGREALVELSPAAMDRLERHHWPGNIRELKNTVERAVYRSPGPEVAAAAIELDPFAAARPTAPPPAAAERDATAAGPVEPAAAAATLPRLPEAVRRLEVQLLRQALQRAGHHQGRAAALLGLSYHQFRGLYRKHRRAL